MAVKTHAPARARRIRTGITAMVAAAVLIGSSLVSTTSQAASVTESAGLPAHVVALASGGLSPLVAAIDEMTQAVGAAQAAIAQQALAAEAAAAQAFEAAAAQDAEAAAAQAAASQAIAQPAATAKTVSTKPARATTITSRTTTTRSAVPTASGVAQSACASGSGVESGLKANTVKVHRAVCAVFPTITSYGGYRAGAAEHGTGQAIDIMVSGSAGTAVVNYLMGHVGELGITQIIYQQRIYLVSGGRWKAMEDRGSVTANHYDHVHVTVA